MRRIFSIALLLFMITGCLSIEPMYAYDTAVTDVAVVLQDYVVARPIEFKVNFKTAHTLTGGRDTITLTFPEQIPVSSEINRENISINQYYPSDVDYDGEILRVLIPSGINILAGESVEVAIASGAISNPQEAGNYNIKVSTSQDTREVTSGSFYITDYEYSNGVSKPSVKIGLVSDNAAPQYTINFKTSANGKLEPGSYIYLTFPYGSTMPASVERSAVKINNTELYYEPDIDGYKLSLRVPNITISAGAAVEIFISSSAEIKKPAISDYNTVKVATSAESRLITSFPWTVDSTNAEAKVGLTVVPLPNGKGQAAAYTVTINPGLLKTLAGTLNNLMIIFPPGTVLPDSIAADKVKINGIKAAGCLIDKHTNALIIIFQTGYSYENQLIVSIDQAAGIKNPSAPAQHKLDIGILRSSNTVLSDWYTIYEQSVSTSSATSTSTTNASTTAAGTSAGRQQVELRVDSSLAYVDGVLQVLDSSPVIIKGVTMVPLRFVANYLGATTVYDTVTASVTVKLGTKEILLWVDSAMAKVNGSFVSMNAETANINNRLMVPVRFVSENLGAQVSWDGNSRLITIVKGSTANSAVTSASTSGTVYPINSKVYIKTTNSYVNLRSGPGTGYETVGKLLQGEAGTIIQVDGNWFKIRLTSGQEAWVANWVVDIK